MRRLRWIGLIGLAFLLMGAIPAEMAGGRKQSKASFSPEREVAPIVMITGARVAVKHISNGSGQVSGTVLKGGKTYTFTKDGVYTVVPGKYRHMVYGKVPKGGAIVSILTYE